jgi:two-component system cell cycle response regulator
MRTPGRSLPKSFWYHGGVACVFIGLFLVVLLVRPGSQALLVTVDNLAQAGSLLLGIVLCFDDRFWPGRWHKRRSEIAPAPQGTLGAQRWIPRIFGLAIASAIIGQIIPLYYTQYLQQLLPTPSWADPFNLSAYLWLLLCLLLLPTYQLAKATRIRLLLDGCMILATVITYSWYFLLGPTLLHTHETVLARIVETAYPCADLFLITYLLLILPRVKGPTLRPTVILFALALGTLVLTDSLFDYQTLQGTYAVGEVLDIGWPLSFLLIALAIKALRFTQSWRAVPTTSFDLTSDPSAPLAAPALWRAVLPYVLVPLTLLLVIYTWHTHSHVLLALGVDLGSVAVLGLVFARQLVALHETTLFARQTQRLNQELQQMQDVVQTQNHALAEANVRLESLATTDPLTELPNHRSLSEQLEREWDRARRYGRPLSLIFFDADHFKRINDTYGHAVGDIVLRQVGERVRSVLRGGDTLGRYGGEEFLVLLPETDTQEAQGSLSGCEQRLQRSH